MYISRTFLFLCVCHDFCRKLDILGDFGHRCLLTLGLVVSLLSFQILGWAILVKSVPPECALLRGDSLGYVPSLSGTTVVSTRLSLSLYLISLLGWLPPVASHPAVSLHQLPASHCMV